MKRGVGGIIKMGRGSLGKSGVEIRGNSRPSKDICRTVSTNQRQRGRARSEIEGIHQLKLEVGPMMIQ